MAENAELSTALGAAEAVANSAASHGHSQYVASAEAEAEAHMRREAAAAAGTVQGCSVTALSPFRPYQCGLTGVCFCVFAESAMLMERKLSSERQRQVETLKLQLQASHESLDKTKAELVAVRMERNETVEKLRSELQTASLALKENRTVQLETRLNTLADSLVEKQGLIDQLISEKVTACCRWHNRCSPRLLGAIENVYAAVC